MESWTIYGYRENKTYQFWYVGQTKNPGRRDKQHRFYDSPRTFDMKVLRRRQKDFSFVVLRDAVPTKQEANYWENFYMVSLKTWYGFSPFGYNFYFALSGPPSDFGLTANAEAHRRLDYIESIKRRVVSAETREKMSKAAQLRIAKYGHPWIGKHHSDQTKKCIGKYHKGKKLSIDHMKAITRQDIPAPEVSDLYLYGFELTEIARMYGLFRPNGHTADDVIRNRLRWVGVSLRPRRSPNEWSQKKKNS